MTTRTEMTRQELYDLVWSLPLHKAAATFPMSHLALKRLCQRHQIPVPPQGHWLKGADRQRQDQISLRNGHLGQQRIWIRRFLRRRAPNHRTLAAQSPPAVEVTGEPGGFQHQCARRTAAVLDGARPNARGAVEAVGDGIAHIRVSPPMLARALAVLDLLLLAADQAAYSVSTTEGSAALVVEGERVPFSILEEIRRRTGKPDGRLTIVLGEMYSGGHRLWTDRPFHLVESRIADVICEAKVHAKAVRARRERRKEAIETRRTEETEHMHRRKRVSLLVERADDLDQAAKLARLAVHLRETDDGSSPVLPDILKWCDAYVAELRENCGAMAVSRDAKEWRIW
ncbi:hypothetical protein SAMN02990966_06109 [Rhodospirillales bacterium URHD0017]|nr:hypothetical protein SAMN02990966_06109 [Rhodospirillales bacterium URHD0017]